jgi:two-component system, chemotaxis family, chemotaxis protein CheY
MQLKALVLDDSKVMRSMLMRALKNLEIAEFEFTEAADGSDGLDRVTQADFDIVFADWNMPKMSGIDFARKLRVNKKYATLPIVMVTSEKSFGKLEEALNSVRAAAYICKPFTPELLARKLTPVMAVVRENQSKSHGGFFARLRGG